MFNKKIFLLTIILIAILSISVVSAEDSMDPLDTVGDSVVDESIEEVSLDEDANVELDEDNEDVLEENLKSSDIDEEQLMVEDYSNEDNPNEFEENFENSYQDDSYNEMITSSPKKSSLGTSVLSANSGVEIHSLIVNYTDGKIEFKVHFTNGYRSYVDFQLYKGYDDEEYFDDYVDQNGYASFSIHLKPGVYDVFTTYYPDGEQVSLYNYIKVLDFYPPYGFKNLYLKSGTFFYGVDKEIEYGWVGTLNAYLKIYKGTKLVDTVKIEKDVGQDFYAIYDLPVGTYTAKIVGTNGKVYKTSTIKIQKMKTYLEIKSLKVKPKSKRYVTVNVYDYYGGRNLKGYVKFKLKGKTYKIKVRKGTGKLKIKMPSKSKTYICKATFYGQKNFAKYTTKFKITVKKVKKSAKGKAKKLAKGKFMDWCHGGNSNHKAVWTKKYYGKSFVGTVKINGVYYKKYVKLYKLTCKCSKNKYHKEWLKYNNKKHYTYETITATDSPKYVYKKAKLKTVSVGTKWDAYTTKKVGKYKVQTYKFKNTMGTMSTVCVFLYKNGKMVDGNNYYSKIHYKYKGKWYWTKWRSSYGEAVYHKTAGIDPNVKIGKVKVKFRA